MSFVETYGLSELSMSALGREMGLPASSLHWHFRTRQELVDRVAQEVTLQLFDAMPAPDSDGPWDEQLITWFTELRQQFLARPRLFDLPTDRALLMTSPPVQRRFRLQIEHVISMLTDAGLSTDDAYAVYHLCGVFVRGFVRVELSDADQPSSGDVTEDEHELGVLALSRANSDRQFGLGLRVLVAGIRATMIDGPATGDGAHRKATKGKSSASKH
jgi:AcrR family transcriptional regulator